MSEELTREQVAVHLREIAEAKQAELYYAYRDAVLAHDAALRAKIEALESRLKESEKAAYDVNGTIDSLQAQLAAMAPKLETLGRDFTEAMIYTGQLERTNADLVQERDRLKEALELCDPTGERLIIMANEDGEVRELCERVGYGAVMDSAARQWRKKDHIGACTVGPCVATVQAALRGETGGA